MSEAQQMRFRDTYPESALVYAILGAVYSIAKAGVGVSHESLVKSQLIMRGIVPVVMAGILRIYGIVVVVIIWSNINAHEHQCTSGYVAGTGLAGGISALAARLAIGIVGDTSVRAYGKQQATFVAMIPMLKLAGALGMYWLITSLMTNRATAFKTRRRRLSFA
eukprot:gene5913-2798_t